MTQEGIITILILIYFTSSYFGFALFTWLYREVRRDRAAIADADDIEPDDKKRLCVTANRSVAVSGILALTFGLYCVAGTLGIIRQLEIITLPWERGLVTTFILVGANLAEMMIAVVLVKARRQLNTAVKARPEKI